MSIAFDLALQLTLGVYAAGGGEALPVALRSPLHADSTA